MYHKLAAGAGATGGAALAHTGGNFSLLWSVVAATALLAAGSALLRLTPRFRRNR